MIIASILEYQGVYGPCDVRSDTPYHLSFNGSVPSRMIQGIVGRIILRVVQNEADMAYQVSLNRQDAFRGF